MKIMLHFLLITLFVLTNVVIANNNLAIAQERLPELKKILKQCTNPVEIQNDFGKILLPNVYGDQKGHSVQTEMLNGLRYYTLEFYWNTSSTTWDTSAQVFYTYDGSGNNTQILTQGWQYGWVNSMRVTITYDASGNVLTYVYEAWTGSAWMTFISFTYTYNAQGYIIEMLFTSMFGGSERATMTYDGNWFVINSLWEVYNGFSWDNNEYYTFTNNTNGTPIEELRQYWSGSAWIDTTKYNYTYNTNGNMTQSIKQYWTSSAWVNSEKETMTYDGNYNNTEYLIQTWSGSTWDNSNKFSWTYDGNNNMIGELGQNWNGSAWENDNRGTLTYDGSNNCTEELWEYWSFGGYWEDSDKYFHQYTPVGAVGDENDLIPTQYSLSNYPNPFNPSTTIKFDIAKAGKVSLKVFDITGKEIANLVNSVMPIGNHEIVFDASNVPSGTYFYRLSTPDFSRVNKMTVMK